MRRCPSCGKEFTGRVDKKFCSPYCKTSFHYIQNKEKANNLYVTIDKALKQNRRILKAYNRAGKATVRKAVLLADGFNPKYFTHYWKNDKGQVYLFCYEYGFLALNENGAEKYVLVQHQPYMN
ncbi:hypothetical protein [Fulvivirga sp.]|uniref:hypothetical protein n=1 Tax=Fulvivirga sp. TaxID=1931237 RepID=UPI0032EE76B9